MLLKKNTKLYLSSVYGITETTLEDLFLSVRGGMNLDEVEIATSEEESKQLEKKWAAIGRMREIMSNMTGDQAAEAVQIVQSRDELMDLTEEYL